MDLDYDDFAEVAADLANKLVGQPTFLDRAPYAEHQPVDMVLSDVVNNTSLRNLQTTLITGRVRSAGLNSGKLVFVSSFGGGPTDSVVQGSQDAANDPRFNQTNVPKQGSLAYPQTALRTEINEVRSTDGRNRQNSFVVHMFVSEISSGRILWEEFSTPVKKKAKKGRVGY
jgi:PBP1b-binding outer membrane lipoprotein LpoB